MNVQLKYVKKNVLKMLNAGEQPLLKKYQNLVVLDLNQSQQNLLVKKQIHLKIMIVILILIENNQEELMIQIYLHHDEDINQMMIPVHHVEDVNQMMIQVHHDENVMIHLLHEKGRKQLTIPVHHEEDVNQMMILFHLDDAIHHLLDENINIIMIQEVRQDDVIHLLLPGNNIQKMMIQVLQDVEINRHLLINEKINTLGKNHHHPLHIVVDQKKNHHQHIANQNQNRLLHLLNQLNPNDDV
jgi:hypothetical protein